MSKTKQKRRKNLFLSAKTDMQIAEIRALDQFKSDFEVIERAIALMYKRMKLKELFVDGEDHF